MNLKMDRNPKPADPATHGSALESPNTQRNIRPRHGAKTIPRSAWKRRGSDKNAFTGRGSKSHRSIRQFRSGRDTATSFRLPQTFRATSIELTQWVRPIRLFFLQIRWQLSIPETKPLKERRYSIKPSMDMLHPRHPRPGKESGWGPPAPWMWDVFSWWFDESTNGSFFAEAPGAPPRTLRCCCRTANLFLPHTGVMWESWKSSHDPLKKRLYKKI